MLHQKQARIPRNGRFAYRVRSLFSLGHMQICVGSLAALAQASAVATSAIPRSARASNRVQASPAEADVRSPEARPELTTSTPEVATSAGSSRRQWSLEDAPMESSGKIFGWRTECPKSNPYAAAGVVPFAYHEEEGQVYVLMSIQRSNRDRNIPLVYTFLGGKVAAGDKKDARRTAAREAHEETHRLLEEHLVLDALLGKVPAYGTESTYGEGSGTGSAAALGSNAAAVSSGKIPTDIAALDASDSGAGNPRSSPSSRPPPPSPSFLSPSLPSLAASEAGFSSGPRAVSSSPDKLPTEGACSSVNGSSGSSASDDCCDATGGTAAEDASCSTGNSGDGCGPYPVPAGYFPSGRYMAFAMHLPNSWHLPFECEKRIRAKNKHPQAGKAEGLVWVSLCRLERIRTGQLVKDEVSGRRARAHHYIVTLLRKNRGSDMVGIFTWLERLQGHMRVWHGLPETRVTGTEVEMEGGREREREAKGEEVEEREVKAAAEGRARGSCCKGRWTEVAAGAAAAAELGSIAGLGSEGEGKNGRREEREAAPKPKEPQQPSYTFWGLDGVPERLFEGRKPSPSILRLKSPQGSAVADVGSQPAFASTRVAALTSPLPAPAASGSGTGTTAVRNSESIRVVAAAAKDVASASAAAAAPSQGMGSHAAVVSAAAAPAAVAVAASEGAVGGTEVAVADAAALRQPVWNLVSERAGDGGAGHGASAALSQLANPDLQQQTHSRPAQLEQQKLRPVPQQQRQLRPEQLEQQQLRRVPQQQQAEEERKRVEMAPVDAVEGKSAPSNAAWGSGSAAPSQPRHSSQAPSFTLRRVERSSETGWPEPSLLRLELGSPASDPQEPLLQPPPNLQLTLSQRSLKQQQEQQPRKQYQPPQQQQQHFHSVPLSHDGKMLHVRSFMDEEVSHVSNPAEADGSASAVAASTAAVPATSAVSAAGGPTSTPTAISGGPASTSTTSNPPTSEGHPVVAPATTADAAISIPDDEPDGSSEIGTGHVQGSFAAQQQQEQQQRERQEQQQQQPEQNRQEQQQQHGSRGSSHSRNWEVYTKWLMNDTVRVNRDVFTADRAVPPQPA